MSGRKIKGRGIGDNTSGRYEEYQRESAPAAEWYDGEDLTTPCKTQLHSDHTKSIISTNNSPDVPFNRSINPYRGCEHGCVYCFARPSHAWLGYSPGLDFETQITYKANGAKLLRSEFEKSDYRCEPITIGANTDAFCTLQPDLSRKMEPRAAAPKRRMELIKTLSANGIPVNLLVAPVIPVLNDHEMETILQQARETGARSAGYVLLRLPHELKTLFVAWLEQEYALKAGHVMQRLKECRGGRDYNSAFDQRMRGEGLYADMIRRRFELASNRLGYEVVPSLNTDLFKSSSLAQLPLF